MRKLTIGVSIFIILLLISDTINALCVNALEANLRNGPGTNYEKTWEVYKYMPFKQLSKKGNWYKVEDVDGDRHWIYSRLVTSRFRCAVIKVNKANVRSGPGTNYPQSTFSPALKYDSFKVLKRAPAWVRVIDEFGDTGWIFRKLLWIQ